MLVFNIVDTFQSAALITRLLLSELADKVVQVYDSRIQRLVRSVVCGLQLDLTARNRSDRTVVVRCPQTGVWLDKSRS